jgi:hypothetical protein
MSFIDELKLRFVQARNIAPELAKRGAAYARGRPVNRPDVEADKCMAICLHCDEIPPDLGVNHYDPATGMCDHPKCKCHMTIKVKWATTRCPLGKWNIWTPPTTVVTTDEV